MKEKRTRAKQEPRADRTPETETERKDSSRRNRASRSRRRERRRRGVPIRPPVLAGVLAGTAAVVFLAVWLPGAGILPDPVQAQIDILPDRRARDGTLHETEGRTVADGDFWVVVNQIPKVVWGKKTCNLEYENPESNHYSARVNLYLTDTGELLGGTRRVDPGNYVKDITLKKKLDPGDYPVTARIELFKNKTPSGGMSLDITLRVLEQEEDSAG